MTTIILADDHRDYRGEVSALLHHTAGMKVVAEADDGEIALRLVGDLQPDLVIMDVVMPNGGGIEATRQVRATYPDVQVIALSMHDDRQLVKSMLDAGAVGYVLKDHASRELPEAIRAAGTGETYLGTGVASA